MLYSLIAWLSTNALCVCRKPGYEATIINLATYLAVDLLYVFIDLPERELVGETLVFRTCMY